MINEMIPDMNEWIENKAKYFLNSGGIDLESWENNYALPKAILCACLKDVIYQYSPVSPEGKDLIKNLENI